MRYVGHLILERKEVYMIWFTSDLHLGHESVIGHLFASRIA
jgi:calcineurin-like phosphoesterase family protein